jgi:hypothetical protein
VRNVRVSNMSVEGRPTPGRASQTVAVADAVVQIGPLSDKTNFVWVQNTSAYLIQFTVDGTEPTDTTGYVMTARASAEWSVPLARAAKFVRATANNGSLYVTEMVR